MKKFTLLCMALCSLLLLGCGISSDEKEGHANTAPAKSEGASTANTAAKSKPLIVYFSMPETTNPNDMTKEEDNSTVFIDGKVLGNTQYIAQLIQEYTDGDIFRIIPSVPYPTNHTTLVELAADEKKNRVRPAIQDKIASLDDYDTIFIGYPNWWGDMPMIMYSFFDEYDFAGKKIIPFNTHGGSGFSNTIESITELEPNADVYEDGFTISRNRTQNAKPEIIRWLNELGYQK